MKKRKSEDIKAFFSSNKNTSSATAQTQSHCIICSRLVNDDIMETHVQACIEQSEKLLHSPAKAPKKRNENTDETASVPATAFEHLMNAAQEQRKIIAYFRLDLAEGLLLPSFFFSSEPAVDTSASTQWNMEVKIKSFRMYCESSSNSNNIFEDVKVKLCTNIRPVENNNENNFMSELHPALLKSMLQKGFRRKEGQKIGKIALALSKLSLLDLLRRLPIILLEDSMLHPSFPILVWLLMACSKGYKPCDMLIAVVLNVLIDCGDCSYKDMIADDSNGADISSSSLMNDEADAISDNNTADKAGNINTTSKSLSLKQLPHSGSRTILASISLRASFGGMDGDVSMLHSYQDLWYKRLILNNPVVSSTNDEIIEPLIKIYTHHDYINDLLQRPWGKCLLAAYHSIDSNSNSQLLALSREVSLSLPMYHSYQVEWNNLNLSPFKLEDMVLEGIDFHCDKGLIEYLMYLHQDSLLPLIEEGCFMEEKLKECIWIFRSSLNKRKLWVPLTTQETYVTAYDRKLNNALDKKKTMSAVWSVIASSCTTYSKMKAAEYYKKYIKVVKQ